MQAYIPPNVDGMGKLLGLISIRNALEAVAVAVIAFVFPKIFLFFLPAFVQMIITLVLGIPPALVCLVGIRGISFTEWLIDYMEFKRFRRIYPLGVPTKPEEKKKTRKKKEAEIEK